MCDLRKEGNRFEGDLLSVCSEGKDFQCEITTFRTLAVGRKKKGKREVSAKLLDMFF